MQTFLPYPDFVRSARSLDYKRLGKQRVEAYQIMRALTGESNGKGWTNHPATNLWRGHEGSLSIYGQVICLEWLKRGYKDSLLDKFVEYSKVFNDFTVPTIIGNPEFHVSHQSNLIRKDPDYYRPIFGDDVPDNLPYVWVVNLQPKGEQHD